MAVQILLGFFLLYILGCALLVGIGLPFILEKQFEGQDTVPIFCSFILYYFFVDLFIRFMLQELPVLSIEPYLTKNIRKRTLLTYLNLRSLFFFLNILPLLIFIPFALITIHKSYGSLATIGFIISIAALVCFNNFLALYIKRKSTLSNKWLFGFFAVITLLGFLDYKNIISIRSASSWLFLRILHTPWLSLIPTILATLIFTINNHYLRSNLYLEEISKKQKRASNSTEYSWLDKYGAIGDLISLEIKMITRNKRPKNLITISVIFLLYGFLFYKPEIIQKEQWGMLLLGAFMVTSMSLIAYGNNLFSWQSSHFDGLLTSKIQIKDYIKSKLYLLLALSTIAFIISNFYAFISWRIILIQLAIYLFNMGVNAFLVIYISTYNYKYLDISQKAAFNYSGTGVVQWLFSLILMLAPALVYFVTAFIFNSWAGFAALAIVGILSLLFTKFWIEQLTKAFIKRKYLMAQGFREK